MAIFSISDIERFTGIKAHTLRIWEQRYNMLIPKRTDTNIRYYDDMDLKFLLNVSILVNYGFKISEVARMLPELIEEQVMLVSEQDQKFSSQIKALTSAMVALDETAFNKIVSTNILQMGLEQTMVQVVFPFLREIGILWVTGSIHPAHEHFITNLVKQKLYVAIDGQGNRYNEQSRRFLLYLPETETHEIGLLFANYVLRVRGHEVIYLGQCTPDEDIKSVFDYYKPEFVVTALTSNTGNVNLNKYLLRLSETWKDAKIIVTGGLISQAKDLNAPENIQTVKDLQGLVDIIASIETKPNKPLQAPGK